MRLTGTSERDAVARQHQATVVLARDPRERRSAEPPAPAVHDARDALAGDDADVARDEPRIDMRRERTGQRVRHAVLERRGDRADGLDAVELGLLLGVADVGEAQVVGERDLHAWSNLRPCASWRPGSIIMIQPQPISV